MAWLLFHRILPAGYAFDGRQHLIEGIEGLVQCNALVRIGAQTAGCV